MDRIDFSKFLGATADEFSARMARAAQYAHPAGTGDARENVLSAYLREVLPGRYAVSKGRVFDSAGRLSPEFDAIVSEASEDIPGMDVGGKRFVRIETVYGVIELKTVYTMKSHKTFIENFSKLDEFRRFYRTVAPSSQGQREESRAELQDGVSPSWSGNGINRVWGGAVGLRAPSGKTLRRMMENVRSDFVFLCIPGRELVILAPRTSEYWGLGLREMALPTTLWFLADLLNSSNRPVWYRPDYGKYRENIVRSVCSAKAV